MATQTTNLGLTKPTTDERWNLSTWNGNMDIIDASMGAVQDGISIVCNGNTHPAIQAGQFAYVRNHSTLAQGLYRNNTGSAIAANAALSSANLTADGSGGLNALKGDIDTLNSNLKKFFVGRLTFDGTGFPVSASHTVQDGLSIVGRNNSTGVMHALWFRVASHDFRVAGDSQPSTGQTVTVFYPYT